MFDQPPENLPVQDILETVDKAPAGAAPQGMDPRPRPSAIRPVQPIASLESPGSGVNRIFLFVGISVVVLIILVGGGTILLGVVKNKEKTASLVNANLPAANVPAANTPAVPAAAVNLNVPTSAVLNVNASGEEAATNRPVTTAPANIPLPSGTSLLRDSDGDGLNDDQEVSIGTNAGIADSDGDGLSDFDEVRKWKSDPLNPDTDGDGFADGAEVKNGYLPTGPGKITVSP